MSYNNALATEKKTATRGWPLNGWRRRDSCSASFKAGWTMPSSCCQDAGRVIQPNAGRILVAAQGSLPQQLYESLQGKPEVGPLLTPRRFHAASRRRRVRRCEPRFHSALSGRGNRTDRTRVRKSYTGGTTCLAWSFGSRLAPAGRQADAQPVASTDPHGQATRPWERLM
jgi:hypothetical protein